MWIILLTKFNQNANLVEITPMSNQKTPSNFLYRKKALHYLHNQHGLDPVMHAVDSFAWLGLLVVSVLIVGIILWSIYGQITIKVKAQGMILTVNQLRQIDSNLKINWQEKNRRLIHLAELLADKQRLFQKHMLTFNDIQKAQDEYDQAKQKLRPDVLNNELTVSPFIFKNKIHEDLSARVAIIFLDPHIAPKVIKGMRTFLLPSMYSAYQYGYIRGQIAEITAYPVSRELALPYIGNQDLISSFFSGNTPFMAIVTLLKNKNSEQGLAWTSKNGSQLEILPGTFVTAEIEMKRCSWVQLLTRQCEYAT